MKRITHATLLGLGLLTLAGCSTTAQRVGTGAAVGAAAGAAIGSASGNAGQGALIGGAAGAVGGAIYDQSQRNRQRRDYQNPNRFQND